jgi:Plasmid encoded RepA protein
VLSLTRDGHSARRWHVLPLTTAPKSAKQDAGDYTMNDGTNDNPQLSLGGIIANLPAVRAAKKANLTSRVHRRLIEPVELTEQDNDKLAFQHTVFCQTSLPYRNPGDDVRQWLRAQGTTILQIEAGQVWHPARKAFVELGLPWGAKPRLILAHLNGELLRQQSPVIEIESSLSAFVKRIRGFDGGREIRFFKDQLTRLANGIFRFVIETPKGPEQTNEQIIRNFTLWPEKDARQRVLWPTEIRFSVEYFESLMQHAVPLNEADLAALAHSALAIDIYSWLAQRLHRINPTRSVFIQWPALKQQFGPDYALMKNFKPKFRLALRQVQARYKAARIEIDGYGMRLQNSPPPVAKRLLMLPR